MIENANISMFPPIFSALPGLICVVSSFTAQPQGPCWFCLGSPEVEKQLIVSVGEHVSEGFM